MLGPEGAPGPVALCAERDTGLVTRGDSGPGPATSRASLLHAAQPRASLQPPDRAVHTGGQACDHSLPGGTRGAGAGRGRPALPPSPGRREATWGLEGRGAALPLSSHLFLLSSCGRPSGLVRSHTPLGKRVRVAGPQRARPGPGHLPACRRPRWMEVDGGGRRGWGTTHGPPPESGALPRLQSGGPLGQCQRHDAAAPPAPPSGVRHLGPPRSLPKRDVLRGGGLLCSLPPPREQQLLLPPPGCRPVPSSGSCLCDARARPAPDSCAEAQGDARRVALGLSGRRGPPAPHVLARRSGTKSRANWDCKCVYLLDLAGFFFFSPPKKSFNFL